MNSSNEAIEVWKKKYPDKFVPVETVFENIHRGDTIFIGSACAEPQHLVQGLINYVQSHPKAFWDTEVLGIRTLGVAPYATEKFKENFRHNSFFIGESTRDAVNAGVADYTPVFLSEVPGLFYRGLDQINICLIQTSLPDRHGYLNLGVSVDIVKAATEVASCIIAQVNSQMPRVHGSGFISIEDINYIVHYDEPLLEYRWDTDTEIAQRIGKYVARLVQDGDTIQVGYGSLPNGILQNLSNKKHLGIHTELLSEGIVELIKKGVIDNSRKNINQGKAVATFCMGTKDTYDFLDDNPFIEFRPIDYTNNPMIIAQHENMVAINSALEIDLTGQATADSIGKVFQSGVGGQADFMRGAVLARGGRSILAIQSTAVNETISRIVPFLSQGAGVTITRGDIHYVITEYGIAYLHGKNVRERAMALIAVAHPKFRPWLIEEAKKAGLVYLDQIIMIGEKGRYPEELETYRKTRTGMDLFMRPIRISDEPLMKEFIHNLSDRSLYLRFISKRRDIPHERLQELVVIDYTKEMAILAVVDSGGPNEKIVGVGRYYIHPDHQSAEVAFAVRDDYHNKGIGQELLSYITFLGKRLGLLGFTAEVISTNEPMLHVFERGGFDIQRRTVAGLVTLKMMFKQENPAWSQKIL